MELFLNGNILSAVFLSGGYLMNKPTLAAFALVALTAGCAQNQTPGPIYAEPVFNKFGTPSCRPPDVPVGGIYTADLPLCATLAAGGVAVPGTGGGTTDVGGTTAGGGTTPGGDTPGGDTPGDDDPGGTQNQTNEQNRENNENNNRAGQ
jgi:hypothetical protein